ncbi:hypothetical protein [Intestinibacter bartlettii]|uniref:hypothetical protein n=1 Tax=Intestinibacter bartlettii TaxID=261299 RepID=UPI0022E2E2EA|nr:hypothetical protein [Intestinibacter bartlettii]
MLFYKYGILYALFGIILYFASPYILNLVNDNGLVQLKILRLCSIFFIVIGLVFTFIKVSNLTMAFLSIAGPWIIYAIIKK